MNGIQADIFICLYIFISGFYGIIQLVVSRIKITKVHWRKGGYCE